MAKHRKIYLLAPGQGVYKTSTEEQGVVVARVFEHGYEVRWDLLDITSIESEEDLQERYDYDLKPAAKHRAVRRSHQRKLDHA